MKLKAKVDILCDMKRYEAGSVFEASAEQGRDLISLGWAEPVKKPAKKSAKK